MADEDKATGANNSGSDSGILPLPLTSLERFFSKNPPGSGGILDGKVIPPPTPDGILPDPVSFSRFANPDQSEAETRRLSAANARIAEAVTPATDTSRASVASSPLQGFQNAGGPRDNPLDNYTNYTDRKSVV